MAEPKEKGGPGDHHQHPTVDDSDTPTAVRAASTPPGSSSYGSLTADENGRDVPVVDEEDEDSEHERRASIVRDLARQYTHQSQLSAVDGNPFTADEDSPLNPHNENFRALAWAKSIVRLLSDNGLTARKAGVCFQKLNVFGYGQPTDYQKNVANIWLEMASLPRQLLGHGATRIDILRDFDGLVRDGEMLVCLGPPGSGCSTFLKTIAGETSGIYVNDDSYFNYQGETKEVDNTNID